MSPLLLLLRPSLSSGVLTSTAALFILGAFGWSYVSKNDLFYDQLFGIYGFKTLLIHNDAVFALEQAMFDNSLTYHIFVIAAGIIIGIITYTLLETAKRTITNTVEELHEIEDTTPVHKTAAREALERLLLRIASMIGWGIYIAVFSSIILPFSVIMVQAGIDAFDSSRLSTSALYELGAFALLTASLHMHVVFARLCALRPRLFGDTAIEEAKHHKW